MVKLVLSRKYPFVSLADLALRREFEALRHDNEELRARIVIAQQEKAVAQGQAEKLRREKERLRSRIASLKQSAESQRRVQEVIQAKIQALREENETLSARIARGD
jgi:chromosome segregation ATPase